VHVTGLPEQVPLWQTSLLVHELPSLHVLPFGFVGFEQTPAEQTPALWHWSLAVHTTGVPVQAPPLQTSPVVHELPSLHGLLLFA
jgi:hypothetical protein